MKEIWPRWQWKLDTSLSRRHRCAFGGILKVSIDLWSIISQRPYDIGCHFTLLALSPQCLKTLLRLPKSMTAVDFFDKIENTCFFRFLHCMRFIYCCVEFPKNIKCIQCNRSSRCILRATADEWTTAHECHWLTGDECLFFFVRCVSRVSRLHLHRLKRWIKRRYIMFMRVDWCNLQQQHAEQTHTHATYTLETKQKKINEWNRSQFVGSRRRRRPNERITEPNNNNNYKR